MSHCLHCKKEIQEGHVMFNDEFKLCSECFDKFYGEEGLEKYMYDNELQYFTEFEEDKIESEYNE